MCEEGRGKGGGEEWGKGEWGTPEKNSGGFTGSGAEPQRGTGAEPLRDVVSDLFQGRLRGYDRRRLCEEGRGKGGGKNLGRENAKVSVKRQWRENEINARSSTFPRVIIR